VTKPDVGIGPDQQSAAAEPSSFPAITELSLAITEPCLAMAEPLPAITEPVPSIAEIFHAHYGDLARLAAMLGADDPEDVAQEAFARLYRRQDTLRDPGAALAYLRATTCNLTRNRVRHLRVASRWLARGEDARSSEQLVIAREERGEVRAALAALPARQRQALVLRYWMDLPYAEIAEVMGVSVGTVKAALSRGTGALARKLEGKLP
jgi:RNA polymerase sigma-70 factor (sigma-E family)